MLRHRWAEERGATHFAHWFQPLTGGFAYKHDSFIKRDGDHVITQLSGKMLVKGEPDGSSFPNGGLRDTHEARGYTVWDPSSPCFIADHGTGTTLCIPSVFFSWRGDAMDEKTPLLRSVEALERQGVRMLKAMGEAKHKRVHADSGVEQEFFLIDRDYLRARPDLMQTGRTLLGAAPPKGQSLDDQYFGGFSDRFLQCLNDAEVAMWKLGIPQTTRHREVAPGQYEMAPVFSSVNTATDHNLLQMDVLTRTAEEHNLAVLFHEKPFAGLNGSGKHNNWSIGTNLSPTVFDAGADAHKDLVFMTFLTATIQAVRKHGDVMRCAVAGAGNDHRLGANEAPPAIMSVFLGAELTTAVNRFMGRELLPEATATGSGDLGLTGLPDFAVDGTDRNRTSPFAFTGNKFEFRGVGSSHNPARSSAVLNTIVADTLAELATALESRVEGRKLSKVELQAEVTAVLQDALAASADAVFDGDNYSDEWVAEAERRGLPNLRSTPAAIEAFAAEKNVELFERQGVLSRREFAARVNVANEEYVTRVTSEALSFLALVKGRVYPAALDAQTKVASAVAATKASGVEPGAGITRHLANVTKSVDDLLGVVDDLEALLAGVEERSNLESEAKYCCDVVLPKMLEGRALADTIEQVACDDDWGMPTYHEMMFHQS